MRTRFVVAMMLLLGISSKLHAQDPTFSQAYLSPIYLNPAATGAGEHDFRFSAIHRRQWVNVPSGFNYSAVSIDKYMPGISSGVGLMATNSNEGYLKKNGIYASYGYTVCAGTKSVAENGGDPKWFWSGGLQIGLQNRRIDYSKLVFADELNVNGVIPNGTSQADFAINNGKWFPDFGAGMYFNYRLTDNSRLLSGVSAHHINRPDESLTGTGDTARSQLPVRWTGNLMYTHTDPERRWSYSLSGLTYIQASHLNYQVGVELTQNEYNVSLGAWYRSSSSFKDMQTIGVSLSFNIAGRSNDRDKVTLGISHDAMVGSNSYSYTAGTAEAAIVWDHSTYNSDANDACKPRISSQSACPIPKK
ncbi:MAG: type IX secretion system membrane protein PorP/SprF [Pedobacter sp.]|nr:MAG: type IX secretion system membrane protein PorP/SprF [Pedobacter sp.]